MSIEPRQKIPSVTIKQATSAGARDVDPSVLFAGKRVVLFSLPGAFTPTCSKHHLPGYVARAAELHAKGVDIIACLSVNDPFVMQAWADAHNVGDRVVMLADGSATFTKALGIDWDGSALAMGIRSRRGVLVIQDGIVESIELEAAGKFEVSSVESCLAKL